MTNTWDWAQRAFEVDSLIDHHLEEARWEVWRSDLAESPSDENEVSNKTFLDLN